MPTTTMSACPTTRPLLTLAMFSALAIVAAGCGSDDSCVPNPEEGEYCEAFQQVSVVVAPAADAGGSGGVVADDINTVQINCKLPSRGPYDPQYPTYACEHTFTDAGGGGSFRLTATADAGSTFVSWTFSASPSTSACQANGPVCICSFSQSATTNANFLITARFDHAPGGT